MTESETLSEEEFAHMASEDVDGAMYGDVLYGLKASQSEAETARKFATAMANAFYLAMFYGLVSTFVAFSGWTREIQYRYFYITDEGHVFEASVINYPLATNKRVERFAERLARDLHTFTYKNYANSFADLMGTKCDKETIAAYYVKLTDQQVFTTAKTFKQRYETSVTKMKILQKRDIGGGRSAWRVEGVLNEDIIGVGEPVNKIYNISFDIEQVPLSVSVNGLQCTQIDENYGQ